MKTTTTTTTTTRRRPTPLMKKAFLGLGVLGGFGASTTTTTIMALETECDVCHVNYFHKVQKSYALLEPSKIIRFVKSHVSTPTFMPGDVTVCREYQHEACCTLDTVRKVPTAMIDALYGDDYNHGLCEDVVGENYPKISEECQAFFDAENCFYECDKNVGKWRRHENCNEEDADPANHNAWEIYKMPIRASTADDMYEACKNDYFPNSKGMWGTEAGGWADAWGDLVKADANGDVRGTCKKGSEIWADGEDMVENVWGEAFKYETDSTKSYVWEFNEGESNPNNKIYEKKPYPPSNCSYHSSIDVDAPSANFPDHCPIDWHLDETSGAKTVSVAAAYSLVILALLFA